MCLCSARTRYLTNSRIGKYICWVRWLFPIVLIALLLLSAGVATSHDPGTAKSPEEARVFYFYQTWYRIPERTMSCCNVNDCHVAEIKQRDGHWFFLDRITRLAPVWREIPPDRLEQNASDPRESPDGSSHVCFNAMYVLCAVLGSGQ